MPYKSAKELHEKYGYEWDSPEEIQELMDKGQFPHPYQRKYINETWDTLSVFKLLENEEITQSKAINLISAIIGTTVEGKPVK